MRRFACALFLVLLLASTASAQPPVLGPEDIGGGDYYYYTEAIGKDFIIITMTFFGPDFPAIGEQYLVYVDLYGNVSINQLPDDDIPLPEIGPSIPIVPPGSPCPYPSPPGP